MIGSFSEGGAFVSSTGGVLARLGGGWNSGLLFSKLLEAVWVGTGRSGSDCRVLSSNFMGCRQLTEGAFFRACRCESRVRPGAVRSGQSGKHSPSQGR
jgi:hypothetical protein